MKHAISKNRTTDSPSKNWSRSFRIGKRAFTFGISEEKANLSFIFEYKTEKGEIMHIKRHVFQRLLLENKVRIAHYSQHKILKKL